MTNHANPAGETHGAHWGRAIALALAVITLLLYWPVRHHDFVNYDDPLYVTENLQVQQGLTWRGIAWAFTSGYASNWHPLTWLSHLLDCELTGPKPGPAHLVNVLFHTLNTVLLFLLLRRLTGAVWRSALVAALFAWHPLHVESVAWVAERKDVLSTAFGLMAIWQYARWGERPTRSRYALLVVFFALSLMAKPMLVTLPFVLCLLDIWPLRRWQAGVSAPVAGRLPAAWRRVREKGPLFLLAGISSVVTFLAQQAGESVSSLEQWPPAARLGNALVACLWYLEKTLWPADLCAFYPLEPWPAGRLVAAILVLAGGGVLAVRWRRRLPWLFVGWFWFLGTLAPVIGIVQVGAQARADRYTYLPAIGLFILFAWGLELIPAHRRGWRAATAAAAGLALGCTVLASALQLKYWRDSESLLNRMLAVTRNNVLAHSNLGFALCDQGRYDEARRHFEEALRINPRYLEALNGLGYVRTAQGRHADAIQYYQAALRIKPDFPIARANLGFALAQLGRTDEAVAQYQDALRILPNHLNTLNNLGSAYSALERLDQALECHRKALNVDPRNALAHRCLGDVLARLGRVDEAAGMYLRAARLQQADPAALAGIGASLARLGKLDAAMECYRAALAREPGHAGAHFNLANALARLGRQEEAVTHYRRALERKPDYLSARQNLGIALGALGRFDEAIPQFEAALKLKPDYPEAYAACGYALVRTGRFAEAATHYAEALRLRPDEVSVMTEWARLRATHPSAQFRNGQEAVRLAERACQLTGHQSASALDTLAAAQAEAGHFKEAVSTAQQALQLVRRAQEAQLAAPLEARLRLYESGKPWREQP